MLAEAGKGFAVVATEVKSLADQTARATVEIGAQISQIQSATAEAVSAIDGIGSTITKVNDIAASISEAVEEQGGATREISGNVEHATAGTETVSSNIVEVSEAAAETGEAAGHVLGASHELSTQARVLRTAVDEFLDKVACRLKARRRAGNFRSRIMAGEIVTATQRRCRQF